MMELDEMNRLNGKPKEDGSLKRKERAGEQGFTLMETTVALVVMMVIGLAVASLFVYAIKFNTGGSDRTLSLAIAQQRMERLRKTPFTDTVFTAGSTTETVVSAGRSYTVVTTICNTSSCGGSDTLKLVTVQVTPAYTSDNWASTPVTVTSLRATPATGSFFQ